MEKQLDVAMLLSLLFLVVTAVAEQRLFLSARALAFLFLIDIKRHPQVHIGAKRLVHKQGWEQLELALLGG